MIFAVFFDGFKSAIRRSAAESAMSCSSRRDLVSAFFALMTHQLAVR
jgi:hypothetical protein